MSSYPVRPVTVSIHIPADPDRVFGFVSDTRLDPDWCPNVSDVRQTTGDGVEVGATFTFHQTVETAGRTLESDVEVEVMEIGERSIRWRVEDRFQLRDVLLVVSPDGDGSRVVQTTSASFKRKPGVAKWLYPMLAKRTFEDQFRRLGDQFAAE